MIPGFPGLHPRLRSSDIQRHAVRLSLILTRISVFQVSTGLAALSRTSRPISALYAASCHRPFLQSLALRASSPPPRRDLQDPRQEVAFLSPTLLAPSRLAWFGFAAFRQYSSSTGRDDISAVLC